MLDLKTEVATKQDIENVVKYDVEEDGNNRNLNLSGNSLSSSFNELKIGTNDIKIYSSINSNDDPLINLNYGVFNNFAKTIRLMGDNYILSTEYRNRPAIASQNILASRLAPYTCLTPEGLDIDNEFQYNRIIRLTPTTTYPAVVGLNIGFEDKTSLELEQNNYDQSRLQVYNPSTKKANSIAYLSDITSLSLH